MKRIRIFLSNVIRLRKDSLPDTGISLFGKRLTFRNPLYYQNERWGKPNPPNIKPTLSAIWHDDEKGDLVIARGYLSELIRILHANRYQPELIDETRTFEEVPFDSGIMAENYGITWPYQSEALEETTKHRFGILTGPLGSGKRMIACKLAARRKAPVLVIVRARRDMYLWKETAARFLRLGDQDIGLIGDGHRDTGRPFTAAVNLTLYKILDEVEGQIGFLIIDQCDKFNLKVLFKSVHFNCPYLLGLASGPRSDGLTGLMEAYLGQRVHHMRPPDTLSETRPVLKIKDTGFEYDFNDDWPEMITALCEDADRNNLIVTDLLQATAAPGVKALVISERKGHLERLLAQVRESYGEGGIITGGTSEKGRSEITGRFDRGKLKILMATFKSVPAMDVKKANHLFICSALKFDHYITQVVGKILHNGQADNRPVIHDYRDNPDLLRSSLNQRLKVYRAMGAVTS